MALTRNPPQYKLATTVPHDTLCFRTSTLSDGTVAIQAQISGFVEDVHMEYLREEIARFFHFVKQNSVAFALLIHCTPSCWVTFEQGKLLNEYVKKKRQTVIHNLKGTVIILPNRKIELLTLSVLSLLPPLKPITTKVMEADEYKNVTITEWGLPKAVQKEIMKGFVALPWPDEVANHTPS